jgi:ADP-L-glycero-D-manno-heptose 6-epimerase
MIVVTGGKGFIGGNLIKKLEKLGGLGVVCLDIEDDTLENLEKWMVDNVKNIDFIFHLGANTNTLEFDVEVFNKYNLGSSKFIWNFCCNIW